MKLEFIKDKRGVAEEFTSLPAIMVVMIGFAIFFAMIATVYHLHNEKVEDKELFEVAHYVALKLTSADSPFVAEGSTSLLLDKNKLDITVDELKKYCNPIGYDYHVKVYEYNEDGSKERIGDIGNKIPDKNKVSASRKVAIKDEIGVKYGEIVVIVWRV